GPGLGFPDRLRPAQLCPAPVRARRPTALQPPRVNGGGPAGTGSARDPAHHHDAGSRRHPRRHQGRRCLMLILAADDPPAVAATQAVQNGDLERLRGLLAEHPALATAYLGDYPAATSRTLRPAATDWPGHS